MYLYTAPCMQGKYQSVKKMVTLSAILLKIKSQHWKIFYYVLNILGILCALAIITVAYLTYRAEQDTVGDFNLKLTFNVSLLFYITSSLLLINSVIGFLAQALPERPTLWIVYCIVLTILSVVVLTASIGATNKSTRHNLPVAQMKTTMENYDSSFLNATKWDDLQKNHKCCGTEGYKDWQDVHFGRTSLRVPISCCLPERRNNTYCGLNVLPHGDDDTHRKIYTKGCLEPGLARVQTMLKVLSVLGLAFAAICLMLATLSCYLVVTKKI